MASKRNEDHPKIRHAQKITHREASGKFKKPPGAPAFPGGVEPGRDITATPPAVTKKPATKTPKR